MAIELLQHACGPQAEQLIFDAGLLNAEAACQIGIAHQRFPRDELQAAALAAAEQLSSLDAGAYALAKASTRRRALSAMADDGARALDGDVRTQWKDDQTRANLEQLLKPKA